MNIEGVWDFGPVEEVYYISDANDEVVGYWEYDMMGGPEGIDEYDRYAEWRVYP